MSPYRVVNISISKLFHIMIVAFHFHNFHTEGCFLWRFCKHLWQQVVCASHASASHINIASGILAMILVLGCKQPGDTKWQFAPDMADGAVPKAQSFPISPPDHAVAMDAALYMNSDIESEAIEEYDDVYASESASRRSVYLEQGEKLFLAFCKHCHGVDGKGDGSITDVFPKPPDITAPLYHDRKGGYFFHKITFGGAMMPSLGHALSTQERFKIILYIRSLQKKVQEGIQEEGSGDSSSSAGSSEGEDSSSESHNNHTSE